MSNDPKEHAPYSTHVFIRLLLTVFSGLQTQAFWIIFMDGSEAEQRARLDNIVLDPDSYWKIRLGTSAVGVCSAILEYATTSCRNSVAGSLTLTDTLHKPQLLPS